MVLCKSKWHGAIVPTLTRLTFSLNMKTVLRLRGSSSFPGERFIDSLYKPGTSSTVEPKSSFSYEAMLFIHSKRFSARLSDVACTRNFMGRRRLKGHSVERSPHTTESLHEICLLC
jgi:hypothetical protein